MKNIEKRWCLGIGLDITFMPGKFAVHFDLPCNLKIDLWVISIDFGISFKKVPCE